MQDTTPAKSENQSLFDDSKNAARQSLGAQLHAMFGSEPWSSFFLSKQLIAAVGSVEETLFSHVSRLFARAAPGRRQKCLLHPSSFSLLPRVQPPRTHATSACDTHDLRLSRAMRQRHSLRHADSLRARNYEPCPSFGHTRVIEYMYCRAWLVCMIRYGGSDGPRTSALHSS